MKKQQDRARNARSKNESMGVQSDLLINVKSASEYVGYTQLDVKAAKVTDIVADGALVDGAETGTVQVVFDKTPFYAEMGGQIADQGDVLAADGSVAATVADVQHAPNGQNLHTLKLQQPMHVGDTFELKVDAAFHSKVEKNHTATHLLDQALRNVFGGHTQQAGSLVEPNYLRFDFTHFGQVTEDDLAKVEAIVNEKKSSRKFRSPRSKLTRLLVRRWGPLRCLATNMATKSGSFPSATSPLNSVAGRTLKTRTN